jgi:hypothetical protein
VPTLSPIEAPPSQPVQQQQQQQQQHEAASSTPDLVGSGPRELANLSITPLQQQQGPPGSLGSAPGNLQVRLFGDADLIEFCWR